jgi:hypothetical protein
MAAAAAVAIAMMFVAVAPAFFGGNDNGDQVLGADTEIDITGKTVSEIKTAINDALDVSDDGDTVTVVGEKTDAVGYMGLTIPEGVTVVWKAVYVSDYFIELFGDGTFEVVDGAVIESSGIENLYAPFGNVYIVVSGGTLENTFDGDAVHIGPGGILVTGGLIKANASSKDAAIYANDWAGPIIIMGGTIEANASDGVAIFHNGGVVAITGGTVTANGASGYAIRMNAGVAAYLDGTVSGPLYAGSSAVIVEVDSLEISEDRIGTSDGVEIVEGSFSRTISWEVDENGDTVLEFNDFYTVLWKGLAGDGGDDGDDGGDNGGDDRGDGEEEETADDGKKNYTMLVFAFVILVFLLLLLAGAAAERK